MALDIKTRENEEVRNFVKSRLPGREVYCNYLSDSSKMPRCKRYIQVQTAFPSLERIHYEYINSHWEFHIEPPSESDGYRYGKISRYLREHIHDIPSLTWENDGLRDFAVYQEEVCTYEQLENILIEISQIFDPVLAECTKIFKPVNLDKPYHQKEEEFKKLDISSEVCLKTLSMKEVFDLKLVIPDYQRIYCWEEKNITALWNNLMEMPADQDYHLGSIILQNMENGYHIIDGQQRLVTLTLCLRALGYEGNMPLLAQRFESKEACENIANAKYVIRGLVKYEPTANSLLLKKILTHLSFSVLILNSQNLNLAYTFFSNQNSRGVRLSDYDILKAHHLRFLISNDQQAEHLARRWNAVSQEYDQDNESLLNKTLGLHLYRMRKWMRKHSCDFSESQRPIKDEYSAAPLIPGIPPLGERFYFYEKIQGGAHFFNFTDRFINLYKQFVRTPQVRVMREHLLAESHWKYESVMETILFAYFSKFGKQYLSEALFCIASVIAGHRYESKALQYKINQYVMDQELVMMIDQASSPSFFLAETLPHIRMSGRNLEGNDIKVRFYYSLCKIFKDLQDSTVITDEEDFRLAKFTDKYIEQLKNDEYE